MVKLFSTAVSGSTARPSFARASAGTVLALAGVFLSLALAANAAFAADWPSWGGQPSRNMCSETETGLPSWFSLGKKNDAGRVELSTTRNVKWVAKLGSATFGSPVVSQGRVFIGSTGESSAEALLLCFDEATGRELGRLRCRPRERYGVCSTPTVEGNRLYFVAPQPEVICLDLNSWLKPTASTGAVDCAQHTLWCYDMAKTFDIKQDHVASCSVLVHGDVIYVCTGNGRDKQSRSKFYPLTPSLIVLDKHTGQLVARDDEQIGEQLWRGQWSSPSLATVNGKPQVLFATGNGYCYGFEPVDPAMKVTPERWLTTSLRGPIVYFIDVMGRDTGGLSPAEYARKFNPVPASVKPALPLEFRYSIALPASTPVDSIPTARLPDVPILKKIWWFDCLPAEYRNAPFYAHQSTGDGKRHPCDIIATPVCYRNRVYVPIGGDPNHGLKNSRGYLACIDATRTGDVTRTGKVWSYDELNAAFTTVAVANGLVFIIDAASVVHCLDAETGQKCWTHTLKTDQGILGSALLVADGKVFVGRSILAASRTLQILGTVSESALSSSSTPCVANGVLFTVLGKSLWAVYDKGERKP